MVRDTTQHILVVGHSTENVDLVLLKHTMMKIFDLTAANNVQKVLQRLWKEALVLTSANVRVV